MLTKFLKTNSILSREGQEWDSLHTNSTKMSSSNNLSNSIWRKTESDSNSIKMYPKTTTTWEQMDAWLEKMFPCGAITWRGFGEVGTESFVVVIVKKHADPEDEEEQEEEWSETCECGALCGGKVFHNEEEFDEHPDREPGYNADGEWRCEKCRIKDEGVECEVCHKTCYAEEDSDLVLITEIKGVKHCDECFRSFLAKKDAK